MEKNNPTSKHVEMKKTKLHKTIYVINKNNRFSQLGYGRVDLYDYVTDTITVTSFDTIRRGRGYARMSTHTHTHLQHNVATSQAMVKLGTKLV